MSPLDAAAAHGKPSRAPEATRPTPLHSQFEFHAARAPNNIALTHGAKHYSYAELNGRANQLAHRLIADGVGRDVPVGLCLRASFDLIVGMLAIMKAGGAYVPLDPDSPRERLSRIGSLAEPMMTLTTSDLAESLPESCGPAYRLEQLSGNLRAESTEDPVAEITGDQLCYLMFTSGSSGVPTGVEVTHENVADLFGPMRDRLGLDSTDVWTLFHSCAFGFSVSEIWGALTHGARLVIVGRAERIDPRAMIELLQRERVSVFSQTPSAFRRLLIASAFSGGTGSLRLILFSGEAIVNADMRNWFDEHGDRGPRLFDSYAITETGGRVTMRELRADAFIDNETRIIGRPVAGVTALILDESSQPVRRGEAGELYVAGPGVARGYLQEPLKTSERFLTIFCDGTQPLRVFRTRDRVRELENGELEFLGRADDQVKLLGYRIELDEIETVLRAHPAIADAAVAIGDLDSGDSRLDAFIVPVHEGNPSVEIWPSVGEHLAYDGLLYDLMSSDTVRVKSYRRAFEQYANGKVVLDIGTGKDALLARLCAEAGAKKVYAVELLEEAAVSAASLVERLGLSDRINVLHGDIRSLKLPEKIDVCAQGIVGNMGSSDGIIPIWNSARRHFAAGCVPVPLRCVTFIAPVELPAAARDRPAFADAARTYLQAIFDRVGREFDTRLCMRNFPADGILAGSEVFEDLDFTGAIPIEHAGRARFRVVRAGRFDGVLLWTRLTTMAGETVDFFDHQQAWLPVYLPLSDDGVAVAAGQEIHISWERSLGSTGIFPDYRVRAGMQADGGEAGDLIYDTTINESSAGSTAIHRRLLEEVRQAGGPGDPSELREWLAQRVPAYMIPATWTWLERLPLNQNGKLDRTALKTGEQQGGRLAQATTPLELDLVSLWTELLQRDCIGVTENFFDLGGDSILAVRITTELQRMLDDMVFLAAIFDAPTIAELAAYLTEHHRHAVERRYGAASFDTDWEDGEL